MSTKRFLGLGCVSGKGAFALNAKKRKEPERSPVIIFETLLLGTLQHAPRACHPPLQREISSMSPVIMTQKVPDSAEIVKPLAVQPLLQQEPGSSRSPKFNPDAQVQKQQRVAQVQRQASTQKRPRGGIAPQGSFAQVPLLDMPMPPQVHSNSQKPVAQVQQQPQQVQSDSQKPVAQVQSDSQTPLVVDAAATNVSSISVAIKAGMLMSNADATREFERSFMKIPALLAMLRIMSDDTDPFLAIVDQKIDLLLEQFKTFQPFKHFASS